MTEYCKGVINHFAQASPETAPLLVAGLPRLNQHLADVAVMIALLLCGMAIECDSNALLPMT